jgi:hypothetical protein
LDIEALRLEQILQMIFREIVITACWIIWKMRNSIIFDIASCNLSVWKSNFKEELGLVCTKAKPSRGNLSEIVTRESFMMYYSFLLGLVAL